MNIAAGDNCVLMAVISQKFALLAHFCIADVVFLLTRHNYRRANGAEQFTVRANVIGRREASETKHREPGNVEKNKMYEQREKKKKRVVEGGPVSFFLILLLVERCQIHSDLMSLTVIRVRSR